MPAPFDVELWHAYFESIVAERPFVRLGAATILENISSGVARPWVRQALSGQFLTRENTKFLVLHQHEALPHGEQIMEALNSANLEERHLADLEEGARKGTVLYLRMAEWAILPTNLASLCDHDVDDIAAAELDRIRTLDMAELDEAACAVIRRTEASGVWGGGARNPPATLRLTGSAWRWARRRSPRKP